MPPDKRPALKRQTKKETDVTIPTPKQAEEARQKLADEALDDLMEDIRECIIGTAPDVSGALHLDAFRLERDYTRGVLAVLRPQLDAALDAAGWLATWEGSIGIRETLILMPKGD
jgi:hypothetical protein